MTDTYLINTPRFACQIAINEGIVISTGPSLNWIQGKKEDLLWNWLNKTFPKVWTKARQENFQYVS